ncbi:hypothetical protein N9D51_01370 [Actinomycetota bacterium]|nr:hypothetical protein [Actinomycetota bacterium]
MKKFAMLVPIALLLAACGSFQSSETSSPSLASTATSTPLTTLNSCPGAIPWDQAYENVGGRATIEGPIVSTSYASGSRGQPTFLNVGKPYPGPDRFTVVIWGYDRANFLFAPEVEYDNKTICVTGLVETYKGSPQIVADTASDIEILE